MPICIECRHPVETLWTEYSGAAGAKGHNIRLTVCRACGNFCDKYVEHDFVVMFIDLVLIKPQVSVCSAPCLSPDVRSCSSVRWGGLVEVGSRMRVRDGADWLGVPAFTAQHPDARERPARRGCPSAAYVYYELTVSSPPSCASASCSFSSTSTSRGRA